MKLRELTYSRKFNIGNYQTEEIGVVMGVDEGEKGADVLVKMKAFVLSQASEAIAAKQEAVERNAAGITKLVQA